MASAKHEFSQEELDAMGTIIAKYPRKRSAIMPLLHFVQSISGYVTPEGIEKIAGPFQPSPMIKFIYVDDPNGVKVQLVENIRR